MQEFGEPGLVVNCAAISQPRACEEDPDLAMAVNVPTRLVEDYLHGRFEGRPALAHLSTDHVYRGRKALVTEDERSEVGPVNAYGRTKLEAETFVSSSYANHAIFRSSIIYGGSKDVGRTLFVQFLDQALGAEGAEFGAFRNEFRSPVYVRDIVTLCATLADRVARGRESRHQRRARGSSTSAGRRGCRGPTWRGCCAPGGGTRSGGWWKWTGRRKQSRPRTPPWTLPSCGTPLVWPPPPSTGRCGRSSPDATDCEHVCVCVVCVCVVVWKNTIMKSKRLALRAHFLALCFTKALSYLSLKSKIGLRSSARSANPFRRSSPA